jgi:prepilin-type N-terminal cleavage/methylation domain-containing protein
MTREDAHDWMKRPPRNRARAAARRRRGQSGFTLIELTVAMLAGLIVAMMLVQVSKEANNTFHEEVRASAAQMSLRVAMERLRNDLQRVAFMSTGNIIGDPNIAKVLGGNNLSNLALPVPTIQRLAGIQLQYGGSAPTAPLSLDPNNALLPDSIELGGNFSSPDEFVGFMCPGMGGGCAGSFVCLEWNTPAMWRVRLSANPAQTLQTYFNPSYLNSNPSPGITNYMARLTDDSGHYHYLLTCNGAGTTTWGAAGAAVNIAKNTNILTIKDTGPGHGGVAGLAAGRVVISPVEIVHWQIQTAGSLGVGPYNYNVTSPADPNEYVLTRSFVDAISNLPDAATIEVVSEYAVDLKFAFTVDGQIPVNSPAGTYPAGTNPFIFMPLDSPLSAAWAPDLTGTAPNDKGPHRIRSVRVRAAIRSAFADRTVNILPVPASGQPYMYRYYIPGIVGGLQWARVRTGVTEASLPNQARMFW